MHAVSEQGHPVAWCTPSFYMPVEYGGMHAFYPVFPATYTSFVHPQDQQQKDSITAEFSTSGSDFLEEKELLLEPTRLEKEDLKNVDEVNMKILKKQRRENIKTSRTTVPEEKEQLEDPGDSRLFAALATEEQVKEKRVELHKHLNLDLVHQRSLIETHRTFKRAENEKIIASLERTCDREVAQVEAQIKSLKRKIEVINSYREHAVSNIESFYEENLASIEREIDSVVAATCVLKESEALPHQRARSKVSSVMEFVRSRFRSPFLKPGVPISVGPESSFEDN